MCQDFFRALVHHGSVQTHFLSIPIEAGWWNIDKLSRQFQIVNYYRAGAGSVHTFRSALVRFFWQRRAHSFGATFQSFDPLLFLVSRLWTFARNRRPLTRIIISLPSQMKTRISPQSQCKIWFWNCLFYDETFFQLTNIWGSLYCWWEFLWKTLHLISQFLERLHTVMSWYQLSLATLYGPCQHHCKALKKP